MKRSSLLPLLATWCACQQCWGLCHCPWGTHSSFRERPSCASSSEQGHRLCWMSRDHRLHQVGTQRSLSVPALSHPDMAFPLFQQTWVSSYIPDCQLFSLFHPTAPASCKGGMSLWPLASLCLFCRSGLWNWVQGCSPSLPIFPAPYRGHWLASSWFAPFGELLGCLRSSLSKSFLDLVLDLVAILHRCSVEAVVFSSITKYMFFFLFLISVVFYGF